jgi:L-asparaginase
MLSKNEKIYISILIFLLLLSCLFLINSYKNRKESYVEIIKNPKIHIIYFSGDLISQNDKDIKLPQDYTEKIEKIVNKHKNEISLCTIHKYDPIIISANINQDSWNNLGKYIANLYDSYDSFLIIHGQDTITYTASALSIMFRNLKKSIILTTIDDLYLSLIYSSISKLQIVAISNKGNIYNAEYFSNEYENKIGRAHV